ncbi:hypothetical protein MHBO_001609 [Bonamia ostreae]|uniref:RGS domain-containing protein n=1 Tax=Bonamia ostreae TaxID=126728 RepID=A0ABV2AKE3_9EUKA
MIDLNKSSGFNATTKLEVVIYFMAMSKLVEAVAYVVFILLRRKFMPLKKRSTRVLLAEVLLVLVTYEMTFAYRFGFLKDKKICWFLSVFKLNSALLFHLVLCIRAVAVWVSFSVQDHRFVFKKFWIARPMAIFLSLLMIIPNILAPMWEPRLLEMTARNCSVRGTMNLIFILSFDAFYLFFIYKMRKNKDSLYFRKELTTICAVNANIILVFIFNALKGFKIVSFVIQITILECTFIVIVIIPVIMTFRVEHKQKIVQKSVTDLPKTLGRILIDPADSLKFRHFLKKEFSVENLDFLEELKLFKLDTLSIGKNHHIEIYKRFIRPDGLQTVFNQICS